jgi:hypothetical protein
MAFLEGGVASAERGVSRQMCVCMCAYLGRCVCVYVCVCMYVCILLGSN